MWWQSIAKRLLQKQHVCFAWCLISAFAAVSGLPLVDWICVLLVAFMTFMRGPRVGAIALLWSATPLLALATVTVDMRQLLLLQLAMVWIIAVCWRAPRFNWTHLFVVSLVLGATCVFGFHLILQGSVVAFWQHWMQLNMGAVWQAVATNQQSAPQQLSQMLDAAAPYMTGIVVASVLLGALLSVAIARLWQLRLQQHTLAQELATLRLQRAGLWVPLWLYAMFSGLLWGAGYLHLAWFGRPVMWSASLLGLQDVMPIFIIVYALTGLLLLHTLGRQAKLWRYCLYAVYALLLWVPNYTLLALGLAVLVDSWVDFRARLPVVSAT